MNKDKEKYIVKDKYSYERKTSCKMVRQFKGYRIDKQIDVQNKVYGIVYIFKSLKYRETFKR